MKGLALQLIGKYILFTVAIVIGIILIYHVFSGLVGEKPEREISKELEVKMAYLCEKYKHLEEIGERDFFILLYGRYLRNCKLKENNVVLNFTLTRGSMENFMYNFYIGERNQYPMVFRKDCSGFPGFKGFIFNGSERKVLYKSREKLSLSNYGDTVMVCPFKEKGPGESCENDLECDKDDKGRELKCLPKNSSILMTCDGNDVAALIKNQVVALGTSNPILECCSKESLIFFRNLANYFNGKKILVIWETAFLGPPEDKYFDSNFTKLDTLKEHLSLDGISLEKIRHTSSISLDLLDDYDQVWILQPGWCNGFTKEGFSRKNEAMCKDVLDWNENEVLALKEYLDLNGKIFISSSYSTLNSHKNMPQNVTNKIIGLISPEIGFSEQNCFCNCGKSFGRIEIKKHDITKGLKDFELKGSSKLVVPKVCRVPEKS